MYLESNHWATLSHWSLCSSLSPYLIFAVSWVSVTLEKIQSKLRDFNIICFHVELYLNVLYSSLEINMSENFYWTLPVIFVYIFLLIGGYFSLPFNHIISIISHYMTAFKELGKVRSTNLELIRYMFFLAGHFQVEAIQWDFVYWSEDCTVWFMPATHNNLKISTKFESNVTFKTKNKCLINYYKGQR